MAAIAHIPRPASSNRRACVRQKAHIPAYATVPGRVSNEMLDLYELLDLSERGVGIQCTLPLVVSEMLDVSLDLAEADGQIHTSARVAWFDSSGRVGLEFSRLPFPALRRLREWLFLNAVAAASNAALSVEPFLESQASSSWQEDEADIFTAVSAVEREAKLLGSDLEAVLALVASRSQSLLRASGAAIALEGTEAETLICRASSGESAPPRGSVFHAGSGFSGECVRTGELLRCDDTESDDRVDRESCRALGIRSMLAAPVRTPERVIGLVEVFSAEPYAFLADAGAALSRFAETILSAVKRSTPPTDVPPSPAPSSEPFLASPGSVLFAFTPPKEPQREDSKSEEPRDVDSPENTARIAGLRLPRTFIVLLIVALAIVFLALGFILAKKKMHASDLGAEQTVLAATPPAVNGHIVPVKMSADVANFAQLRELASDGDAAAENALGLLFAQGDEKQAVHPDEREAARFFIRAAEHGYVPAQSKLGSLYLSGRGVTQDLNRAYFWTVLARASGDDASKVLAPFIATRLTLAQRAAIEQQAEQWLQQHELITRATR